MIHDDAVVTRRELREELAIFKTELKTELKTERDLERSFDRDQTRNEIAQAMGFVVDRLGAQIEILRDDIRNVRGEMAEMKTELLREIAGAARAAAEEHRRELGVLDDRYRELPGRVAELERGLDEHRHDPAAHSRPLRR